MISNGRSARRTRVLRLFFVAGQALPPTSTRWIGDRHGVGSLRRAVARALRGGGEVAESGAGGRATQDLERVAQVVDVAERVRSARIADQAQQVVGQGARDLDRHRQVLVLFL